MKTSPFDGIKRPATQAKGTPWSQYLAILTATLSALGAGLHFGWPSPSLRKLHYPEYHLNISATSRSADIISSIAPVGYLIGAPLSAVVVDIVGRKCCLLLLAIPQLTTWFLVAFSRSAPWLYIGRVITGIGEGALFTVLPMYLGEISDPKVRGVLGSSLSVAFIGGILLINCYGSYVSVYNAAFISMAIPMLFVIVFIWMPESPYYYLMKRRTNDARKSLQLLRKSDDVEIELMRLNADVERQISEPGSIKDLFFDSTNRKAFLVILGLRTVQVFSGLAAFNIYTQDIFRQAGGHTSPSVSAIIYTATQMSVTFFGSVLADKFGRRPLLMISCGCSATLLVVEGFYFYFKSAGHDMTMFKVVPLVGMMLYIISFSLGLGVAPNLMLGELFAAKVKAKALSILTLYFALGISTSAKLFRELERNFGMCTPFFVFSVVCYSGVFFAYYCVPETKGRTLEEIQQLLKGKVIVRRSDDCVTKV